MLIPENLEETILELRMNDPQCQQLLEKSYALSEQYFQVMESLNPADRELIQQYLALCEDVEDRTVQLVAAHYATHGATAFVNTEL